MKQKAILKTSIITIFLIIIFISVVIFTYFFTAKKFLVPQQVLTNVQNTIIELKNKNIEKQFTIKEQKDIFTNLVMKRSKEDEKLEGAFLEVVNVKTGKLMMITIPMDTKVSMSNELYISLQSESPTIPQILLFENIVKFSGGNKSYSFAKRVLEDILSISITYYTVLPADVFDAYFIKDNMGVIGITKEMEQEFLKPVTVRKTKEEFEKLYALDGFFSSMDLKEKYLYLEYYESLSKDRIIPKNAEGDQTNEAYLLNILRMKQDIYDIQNEVIK